MAFNRPCSTLLLEKIRCGYFNRWIAQSFLWMNKPCDFMRMSRDSISCALSCVCLLWFRVVIETGKSARESLRKSGSWLVPRVQAKISEFIYFSLPIRSETVPKTKVAQPSPLWHWHFTPRNSSPTNRLISFLDGERPRSSVAVGLTHWGEPFQAGRANLQSVGLELNQWGWNGLNQVDPIHLASL